MKLDQLSLLLMVNANIYQIKIMKTAGFSQVQVGFEIIKEAATISPRLIFYV